MQPSYCFTSRCTAPLFNAYTMLWGSSVAARS
jgi:hypothetical protein